MTEGVGREVAAAELALVTELFQLVLLERAGQGLAEDTDRLLRAVSAASDEDADQVVADLEVARANGVARACTVQLHLVNLVEEREQARGLRSAARSGAEEDPDEGVWPPLSRLASGALDAVQALGSDRC